MEPKSKPLWEPGGAEQRRGQTQAPALRTRAKGGLRSGQQPPLARELPVRGSIGRIRNLSYVVESRRGWSSGRNLGAVAFDTKNPGEGEESETHPQV